MKTLVDRIAEWREDDEQGYDKAIDLLCEAESLLICYQRRCEWYAKELEVQKAAVGPSHGP